MKGLQLLFLTSIVCLALGAPAEHSEERKIKVKGQNYEDVSAESLSQSSANVQTGKNGKSASKQHVDYDRYEKKKKNKYEIEVDESSSWEEDKSKEKSKAHDKKDNKSKDKKNWSHKHHHRHHHHDDQHQDHHQDHHEQAHETENHQQSKPHHPPTHQHGENSHKAGGAPHQNQNSHGYIDHRETTNTHVNHQNHQPKHESVNTQGNHATAQKPQHRHSDKPEQHSRKTEKSSHIEGVYISDSREKNSKLEEKHEKSKTNILIQGKA